MTKPSVGPILAALLSACALLGLAACGGRPSAKWPDLQPTPDLDLSGAEAGARDQLESQRAEIEALLAQPATADAQAEAAESFGALGLLYVAYEFLAAAEVCLDNAATLQPEDYRWTYLRGYLAGVQGRLPEAVARYEETLEREEALLPAWLRLGRAHLELGESAAARRAFEEALRLAPEVAAAHEGLGRVAAAEGDPAAAVEAFERALALEPRATGVYYALGQAHRDLGDGEAAAAALARRGDVATRIPDPLISSLANVAESAQFYLMQGAEALEDERFEDAAAAYREAIERDPGQLAAARGLAFALEALGDAEGAIGVLEEGLEWVAPDAPDDDLAEVLRLLGGLHLRLGRHSEGIERLRESLALNPDRPTLRAALANALARTERFDEALVEFDRLVDEMDDSDPAIPALWEKRGTVRMALGQRRGALADFRAAAAAEPADSELRRRLAAALDRLGDSAAAARERAAAERLAGGSDGVARLRVAESRVRAGRYEEAIALYRETLRQDPTLQPARFGLASVLGHLGRFDQAVAEFEALLESSPRSGVAHRGRVVSLLLAERWGEARLALRDALSALPRDRDLALTQIRLLATAPDPRVRDGALAEEVARRVAQVSDSASSREALALALAEQGLFPPAIELQRSLSGALAAERLAAFEAGRAWTARGADEILVDLR
ncbi:MAG: tetratricopeptide repeat protein [Acidobacteriota bacterium]